MVLAVLTPAEQILLGADLEESKLKGHLGWSLILDHSTYKNDVKGEVFKVPHHGSYNGHHERVWKELLLENPIAIIAPFNKNPKLPRPSDLERISGYTNSVHVTTPELAKPLKSREKHIRRVYDARNATEMVSETGIVRLRRKVGDAQWSITYAGAAYQHQQASAA